uniref:Uncharacterized protein n=1 Tax=Peronospora matthiolae TaxID=2874970 RepID=A0AAV1TDS6_9STRA
MDEAGERLVVKLDKAKSKKSKYNRTGLQLQEKLRCALKQVAGLQADQEKLCHALKQVTRFQA